MFVLRDGFVGRYAGKDYIKQTSTGEQMGWQATPYTIPLGIAALVVAAMLALTITQRDQKGAYVMMGLFTPIVVWAGAYALQLASTGLGQALFWNTVRFAGPAFVAPTFLVFALQYTGREHLITRRNVALLSAIPTLTVVLIWTNHFGLHGLVRASAEVVTVGGIERLDFTWGPWYYVHALYSFALTFGAIGLFVSYLREATDRSLRQTQLFLLGSLFPTMGSLLFAADFTAIDWGPVAYVVTAVLLVVAIFYY